MVTGVKLHSSVLNSSEQLSASPDLPPLLLLHGLFGMGDNLAGVGRALQDHFTVYKLDLRNHGRSERSDIMTFAAMAADVALFMDENNMPRAAILGHSLGGKVGMQLAINYPEKVKRLIVADIAPATYKGGHTDVFAGLKAVDLQTIKTRRDADIALAEHIDEEMIRLFILKNLYRNSDGQFDWRLNVDAVIAAYPQLCLGMEGQQPFDGPVLFIKGELSPYVRDVHMPLIKQLFPQSAIKVIANAISPIFTNCFFIDYLFLVLLN